MNPALWLLIGLQLRGWLRYLLRGLRTVKGLALALVGGGVFLCGVLPVVLLPTGKPMPTEQVRLYGPAGLLLYCVLNVLASTGERSVYFTPAEVSFLFPGPFGRREVLGYKIALTLIIGLPTTLLMAAFLHVYAPWFPAAYVGLLLMFVFLQLFSMAVNLVATSVGARLYTRGRKLVLAGVVLLALVVLFQAGVLGPGRDLRALAVAMVQTPAWQAASWPLHWFFDAFLASRLWPDLVVAAGLSLLVDVALLSLVLALDAHYLETASAASARIYARLQRLRRGGLMGDAAANGRARLSLPVLPWWGGVGPILWRQLTTALRGLARLLVVLAILGLVLVLPLLGGLNEQGPEGEMGLRGVWELPIKVAGVLVWLTVFLTALVPFDFRGDVDRIAFLKTLPLPAWRLTVGQLLTPVILITGVQWLVLAGAWCFVPESGPALAVLAAYAVPFNFLLFALENLLFLLFPSRVVNAATPGDFQALGRNVLFLLAKGIGLLVVFFVAALVGVLAWWGTGENVRAGLAAAWPVVAVSGAALVPLIALAFRAFDVGRDTPA
jgi:hypothetical protein